MAHRKNAVSFFYFVIFTVINIQVILGDLVAEKVTISPLIKRLLGYPEENLLNFAEEARANGYIAETHYVTTEDGYILMNFRMKSSKCRSFQSVPVLLIHGFALNSDVFLVSGKDAAVGYLLADECYDVWAINTRGNNYSRNHTTLDPDSDTTFWDFSIDELSIIDNVAVIDYILKTNAANKLNVIGFSLGGGTPLISLAAHPDYNEKLGVIIGLAPAVSLRHTESLLFAVGMRVCYELQDFLSDLGIKEILSKNSLIQTGLELFCQFTIMNSICDDIIIPLIDTSHPDSIAPATIRRFFSTIPMGVSVRLAAQGQQWVNTEKLAPYRYDYGSEENLKVYGSETPPAYDFSQISTPVVMFHGKADHTVTTEAINELVALLPNVTLITVDDPLWDHLDMEYSKLFPTVIFPTIIDYLEQYNN